MHNGDIFQTMESGKYEKEIYTGKSGYTMQTMESEDYEKEVWKICSEARRKLCLFKY